MIDDDFNTKRRVGGSLAEIAGSDFDTLPAVTGGRPLPRDGGRKKTPGGARRRRV